MYTIAQLKADLRHGSRGAGGYPVYWVTQDGSVLCWSCCVGNMADIIRAMKPDGWDRSWRVNGYGVHWEGPPLPCDHCGRLIPSAYGDPDGSPCYVPRHRDASVMRRPWPSHVYRVDGLPQFRVARSPGGPRVEWYDYRDGIGLYEELSDLRVMIRRDRIPPMIAGRMVARRRYLKLSSYRYGR